MSLKLKHVVTFLKITICFLLSRPFGFIRQAGVQYLSNNPERFIESNTENSWNECITIMSMQGTWCNAVADCQNAAIHIIESHENLAGETLIEPH